MEKKYVSSQEFFQESSRLMDIMTAALQTYGWGSKEFEEARQEHQKYMNTHRLQKEKI